jgi:hypothetical protein
LEDFFPSVRKSAQLLVQSNSHMRPSIQKTGFTVQKCKFLLRPAFFLSRILPRECSLRK